MLSTMQMRTLGCPSSTRNLGSTVTLGGTRKNEALNPKGSSLQLRLIRTGIEGHFLLFRHLQAGDALGHNSQGGGGGRGKRG